MGSEAGVREHLSADKRAASANVPSFEDIVEEFAGVPGVSRGKSFGQPVLKVDGKVFASFREGHLVVKLPPARIDALVTSGRGALFSAYGKTMRGWVAVPSASADEWLGLTEEALAFVRPS